MNSALIEKYLRENQINEMPAMHAIKTPGDSREDVERALAGILAGNISGELTLAEGYAGALSGRPEVGELSMLVDWSGEPRCIVRTQALICLTLGELGEREWRALGGEGSLDRWLEETRARVKNEAEELSLACGDDTPLTLELFERIYPA